MANKKLKVLLTRFDHIGDWLIFNDVWRSYFAKYKNDIHFDLLVSPRLYSVLKADFKESAHSIDVWNTENFSMKKPSFWFKYIQLSFKNYDYIINPVHSRCLAGEGIFRLPFLFSKRIGSAGDRVNLPTEKEWINSNNRYDVHIPVPDIHHFERDRDIAFLEKLFPEVFQLPALPQSELAINRYFVTPKPKTVTKKIFVAPISAHESKNWPLENFANLMQQLHQHYPAEFIVSGGGNEGYCIPVLQTHLQTDNPKQPYNIEYHFGDWTFNQVSACIYQCDLVISNDSALFHVASLSGIPCVCIGNGTILNRFYPYPSQYTHSKSVYPYHEALENRNIKQVSVESVFAACEKLLKQQAS